MNQFKYGSVQVNNDVIDMIIAEAAARVEGVSEVKGYDAQAKKLRHGRKKAIETTVDTGKLTTSIKLSVASGYSIVKVAEAVQVAVRDEIRSMLGLEVDKIDVSVV